MNVVKQSTIYIRKQRKEHRTLLKLGKWFFLCFIMNYLKQNEIVLIVDNQNFIKECENNCIEAEVDYILKKMENLIVVLIWK